MADLLHFSPRGKPSSLAGMSQAALLEALSSVRAQLRRLDDQEPEDMTCSAYDGWANQHEALEDLADEILDRLDSLEGRP